MIAIFNTILFSFGPLIFIMDFSVTESKPATTTFKEGDIIITNIRVVFVFFDSSEPVVFVWTNILDIKYAKGRPIIGIKTVIAQFDDILIHLLGRLSPFINMFNGLMHILR